MYNPFIEVNRMFRPISEARRMIGLQVTTSDGTRWQVVDHNDLGCLYWAKVSGSAEKSKLSAKHYTCPEADALAEAGKWG